MINKSINIIILIFYRKVISNKCITNRIINIFSIRIKLWYQKVLKLIYFIWLLGKWVNEKKFNFLKKYDKYIHLIFKKQKIIIISNRNDWENIIYEKHYDFRIPQMNIKIYYLPDLLFFLFLIFWKIKTNRNNNFSQKYEWYHHYI